MREPQPPKPDDEDDPWAFVAARNPKPADPLVAELLDRATGETGARLDDVGAMTAMQALHQRARPLAWAVAAVFFFGFVTEVVAASRFVYLLGPKALVIIYLLGGVCLVAVALVQMTWIDRIRRDKAFIRVTVAYAIAFVIALLLIANQAGPQMVDNSGNTVSASTVWGTGFVWLLADQLNFLLPLIVWAIVGDLFNAGEGRKVYPWVTSWQYGGQLLGLAVPALAPLLFVPLGLPLWSLLVICPIGILLIGVLLPRALRGRAIGRGHGRDESLGESLRSTWDFVGGVKAFTAMFLTSVLVFIAGMTLEASYLSSADRILGDEAKLQILYGSTLVVVFIICGLLQKFATTRILERLNIPGSLAVLPIGAVVAALLLILGLAAGDALPLLIVGIICWWVPRWSIDDVARRAALAVVPDERRARVSFVVDLVPFACGLFVAGLVTLLVDEVGHPVLAPVIALPFAVAAIIPARRMVGAWADSLLDARLRRRKRLTG